MLLQNKGLTSLFLASNDITSIGCHAIIDVIIGKSIQHLNLACNKLGDEGAISVSRLIKGKDLVSSIFLFLLCYILYFNK
jgi:hypothetical protein